MSIRPRSDRVRGQVLAVITAGCVTGLAAGAGAGPFARLPGGDASGAAAEQLGTPQPSPVRADALYPPPTAPPARHETLVITDPAPAAPAQAAPPASSTAPAAAPPPATAPAPPAQPSRPPSPSPRPSPSGTPEPGDD